jgi:hypothetical protein
MQQKKRFFDTFFSSKKKLFSSQISPERVGSSELVRDWRLNEDYQQGDQIRRKFAKWMIACRWLLHENFRSCPLYGLHYSTVKFILTKNCLCYILGDVFANSSGHPDCLLPFSPRNI